MQKSLKKSGDFSLKKYVWAFVIFASLWSQNIFAQLLDFELTVVATDETCSGNGTLTFTVDNPTPGATILYTVYLLPDITNPVSSSVEPFVGSLDAGTYKVVAIETLGTLSLTETVENVVVNDNMAVPLQINASSIAHNCDVGGEIVVNTLSGTATGYAITEGPQLMTWQASNIFTGMPEGVYTIVAYNECSEAYPYTFFHELNPAPPIISGPIFQPVTGGDCNMVTISNTIEYPEGTAITYPLTVQYTITPPGGGTPEVVMQYYETGVPTFIEFSHTFPVVPGEGYTYNLLVTNGCGQNYGVNGLTANPTPTVSLVAIPLPCGRKYLSVNVSQFMPPFTMQFLDMPADFNPSELNAIYPGPYTDGSVDFGDENIAIPEGNYHVQITDACGRIAEATLLVEDEIPEPAAAGKNNGCYADLGRISVSIPDRQIVSATVTAAPPGYGFDLPHNVSSFINANGALIITNVPLGDYTLIVIDNCGHEYTVEVNVPEFVPEDFTAIPYSDCTIGMGAVRVSSGNGKLEQMFLTQAPAAYTASFDLPQNVSAYIDAQGRLFMDSLPEGNYTFSGTDICGIQRIVSVIIAGYLPATGTPYIFDPHCNSWSITLSDTTTGGTPTYWLQLEDPAQPGQWVHPDTGAVYPEGTMPSADNSFELPNNQVTNNLYFSGNFRVVRAFVTVGMATPLKVCFTELGTFEYLDDVTIDEVYNISCRNNTDEVLIVASGLAPLTYRVIKKDGVDFVIDNGQDNIFSNLDPAVYVFEVENACGETKQATRNINLLPDLVQATDPVDILNCIDTDESEFQVFDLTAQSTEILGQQSADVYTITYYTNQQDAENELNHIPNPEAYTNTTASQIIYARVQHNQVAICHRIVSFIIQVSVKPVIDMAESAVICDNLGFVMLTASAGYDSYVWSTGETTPSIVVTEPGEYSVTVRKDYGIGFCETPAIINVERSASAENISFKLKDWTQNDNSITVNINGLGVYEYSIDGTNYQESNVFTGLETGVYIIYIRDVGGCGETSKEVVLLNYPKFFTPNNDGQNDTWRIEYAWFEPNMMLYIYDRYGKLITSFSGQSTGWDGTLNGHDLPSTDYWFVANREDGRIFKGHFSMIR
ncbi:MAG: T9SS type B sorting domain-containing protein [Bacteroidota bacterium]